MSILGNDLKVWVRKGDNSQTAHLYWTNTSVPHSKPQSRGECVRLEIVHVGLDEYIAVTTSETQENSPIVCELGSFNGFWTSRQAQHTWSPMNESPGAEEEDEVTCDGDVNVDLHE